DDRARRRDADHDREPDGLGAAGREAHRRRSRVHPARRRGLRGLAGGRREATGLEDDDGGEGPRDRAGRRHRHHPSGPTAPRRAPSARRGAPPGRRAAGRLPGRRRVGDDGRVGHAGADPLTMATTAEPATVAAPVRATRALSRPVALGLVGIAGLVLAVVAGVGLGSVAVSPVDTIAVLGRHLLGLPAAGVSPAVDAIVWDLRLPRVLTTLVVGLGLAVAGTTFQGL